MQPQVVGREVIASTVPVSVKGIYTGGDRGFVDAVDESSGRLLWGFDTVASPTLWGNAAGELRRRLLVPTVVLAHGRVCSTSASPNPAPFVGTLQYPNGTSRPGQEPLHGLHCRPRGSATDGLSGITRRTAA